MCACYRNFGPSTVIFFLQRQGRHEGPFRSARAANCATFLALPMLSGGPNRITAPLADASIMDEIKAWQAVVVGVGDCGSCSSCSLHDAIAAERQGVPAIGVMTTRFVSAAEMMCRV
jgi:hypothetical protein